MQNRWTSKILWTGIASLVIAFLLNNGVIDVGLSDTMTSGIDTILTILGLIGVVNNPTDSTNL